MTMLGKPAASLSSGLLARKGHARPAMRPQGYMQLGQTMQDDLGWNDMGDEGAHAHHQPHPAPYEVTESVPAPPVLRPRAELEEQITHPPVVEECPPVADEYPPEADEVAAPEPVFEAEPAPAPIVSIAKAPVPAPATVPVSAGALARVARETKAGGAKAAFTLRLDTDRHLRLRLASAVRNRSAQQLVTEALDAFLESLTEVDDLARQIAGRETRHSGE
jgi:hypothetical protein